MNALAVVVLEVGNNPGTYCRPSADSVITSIVSDD